MESYLINRNSIDYGDRNMMCGVKKIPNMTQAKKKYRQISQWITFSIALW